MADIDSLPEHVVEAVREAVGIAALAVSPELVDRIAVAAYRAALQGAKPDDYSTGKVDGVEIKAPRWRNVPLVGDFVTVWPEDLDVDRFSWMAGEFRISDIDRAAQVLLAVAQEMRKHDAWKEHGGG